MTSYVTAKKNKAWIGYMRLSPRAGIGTFQNNPTLAAGDVKVSIDGGALANLATLPVVTPAGSDWVKVSLSSTEMNGDNIMVQFKDAAGNEWCDDGFVIQTTARQIDDLAYPATSGRSMVVDAAGLVDANMVKAGPSGSGTAQTARDLGASVIIGGALAATGLGAVRTGTARAGTVSSVTLDSGASSTDNFYRGLALYIVGGTGIGQVGLITGYVGSTKVATTSPQWRTNPDNTSVFALLPTGGVNVEMWRTGTLNNVQSGRPDVYVGAFASGVVDATAIATDAIGSAELAASAVNKIRDAILSDSTAFAGASIAAIKAKTDNLPSDPADASDIAALFTALTSHGDSTWSTITAAAIRAAVGLASANLDTQLAALPSAAANAAALLDAADAIETSITVRKALRGMAAILLGKVSGGQTGTEVFRAADDSKDRVTSTNDAQGNRTAVTMDLS